MKQFTFTVRGKGEFPIDMLRYDSCWPMTAMDAAVITESFDALHREKGGYEVTLTTTAPFRPTNGRWESFMFKVMPKG